MHGETIGRHYVKTCTRQKHNSSRLGFCITRRYRLIDGYFAGQVQIMRPGSQASFNYGIECVNIGTGAVQYYGYIFKCLFDSMRIAQIENPAFHTQFSRQCFDPDRISPREDRFKTALYSHASGRLTYKTRSAI
jgi:hypothetical protein